MGYQKSVMIQREEQVPLIQLCFSRFPSRHISFILSGSSLETHYSLSYFPGAHLHPHPGFGQCNNGGAVSKKHRFMQSKCPP